MEEIGAMAGLEPPDPAIEAKQPRRRQRRHHSASESGTEAR